MSGSIEATIKFSIVPEAVADHSILGLSANAVRLYAILDRYGNSEGAIACPSRRTLARRCGFSTDTVDRAKAELVKAGLLEEMERFGDSGAQTTNEYRLLREPLRTDAEGGMGAGAEGPLRTDAEQQREPSTETSSGDPEEGAAAAPRARDEIWDFLEEQFGSVGTDRRAQAHQKRNKACADLKRLEATVDELRHAVLAWSRQFVGATLTDIALATHFPQLRPSEAKTSAEPVPVDPEQRARVQVRRAGGEIPRRLKQGVCPECSVGGGMHTTDCTLARETPRRAYRHFIEETAGNPTFPLDEIGRVIDSWSDIDDVERQHYRDLAEEVRANHEQEAA